ncbi:MAG TPA: menaquinone biosynthesis protein [Terriglobales bacterium]|jgi:chorismate dehydratase|nr:menaquinone biosynthesis protein [Terriglobales bacterium]
MSSLRVSAIGYLNTAPLMWNFEHGSGSLELRKDFEIDYTIPSRCAEMLDKGAADIGIIPVAAYTAIPGLRVIPDVAIASRGAVRSILLISLRPLSEIRSVALDSSSRTSAALIQVLLRMQNREVTFARAEPKLDAMLEKHDAALLIGDPALQVDRTRYQTWDLAEEWRNLTGKPFVFAFWAVRENAAPEEELSRVADLFRESRDEGLKHITEIADEWSSRLSVSQEAVRSYLKENIHYYLDPESISGMKLFFDLAASYGILPSAPELRLVPELAFRNSTGQSRV